MSNLPRQSGLPVIALLLLVMFALPALAKLHPMMISDADDGSSGHDTPHHMVMADSSSPFCDGLDGCDASGCPACGIAAFAGQGVDEFLPDIPDSHYRLAHLDYRSPPPIRPPRA